MSWAWLPTSCLAVSLLLAAGANAQTRIGAVYLLPPSSTANSAVTEGNAIIPKVRAYRIAPSRSQTFNLKYRVDDHPTLDLIDTRHEGIKRLQFNSNSFDAASAPVKNLWRIPTKPDARCKDGYITITLLGSYNNNLPFDVGRNGRPKSLSIPVRDDGKCPVISIEPDPALERNGVTEGGAFDFTLKRINPKINDRKVRLNWEVVDDSSHDFLPGTAEGRKSHELRAYAAGDSGFLGARHDTRVQTRIDPGSDDGAVTVRLLASEYYNLGTKTTLTVPVKDDTGYAARVLEVQDLTVAENELEILSLFAQSQTGFRLPMFLEGNIATSAEDPSVRVSFVNSGGGCKATANAQDLATWAVATGYTPRTSWPAPKVITWDVSRPEVRSPSLWQFLMDDNYHEGNETLCVRFDQPRSLKLPGGVNEYFATVTIENDDPAPTITIDSPRAAEDGDTLDFTVTLTNPPQGKDVTVRYRDTGRGSATSGTDYTALADGVLTFPADAGDAPQEETVKVALLDDRVVEDDETVVLRFSRVENADFRDGARGATTRGTISDDDAHKPHLRLREAAPGAGPVAVQEGQTAVFHVDILVYKDGKWQVGALDDKVVLSWYVTADDEDTASGFSRSDFFGYPNTLSTLKIPAGNTGTTLEVRSLVDQSDEAIETFQVKLAQAYFAGSLLKMSESPARGAIYDGPTLRIAAPKGPATEGNRLRFPVTLGVAHDADISVAWKTESLTAHTAEAGKDYVAASGTLVFKAGEIDKVIRVKTLQDSIDEPAEDFSVVLANPNVAGLDMGPARAVGIIRDDDKRPVITIGDVTVTEGETLILPIALDPVPAIPMRLEWRVRAPNVYGAIRGADYTGADSGTITVAAGQSAARLAFPTIDDPLDEPTETFEVALVVLPKEEPKEEPLFFTSMRDKQQADILAPLTATATILDNDTPSLSIDDVEVREGGKPVVFTVRLSSPRTYPVEVEFRTMDGGGPKLPGGDGFFDPKKIVTVAQGTTGPHQDYEGLVAPRTVRFAPGETEARLLPIRVVDDDRNENSEHFQGVISLKSGGIDAKAIIAKAVGLATIRDNDSTRYWIANRSTTIREGRSVRIRVKRSRDDFRAQGLFGCIQPTGRHDAPGHAGLEAEDNFPGADQVDAYIENLRNPASVCSNPQDDSSVPARFSFENGEDEASFWVHTVDDDRKEPDETFAVYIHPGTASGGTEDVPQGAKPTDFFKARTVFTILDDDDIHRFRVVSANSPWEGEDAHFDIYADSAAGLAVLKASSAPFAYLNFGATADTAVNGEHYRPRSNTVDLDLSSVTDTSQRVGRVSVPTVQDEVLDGNKTVTVSIAELFAGIATRLPFRPTPGGGSATATIRDDEAYHLSVLDAVGDEGDEGAVEVRLSKPAERDVTIRFRTRQGTAKAPEDFTACGPGDAQCALVIPAGKTEAQFRVPTTEDAIPEETEQFRVVIADVDFANIIIDRRAAIVKIRDDDARSVAISGLADASVPENSAWTSPTPAWTGSPDGGMAWTLEGNDATRFTIDPDTGVVTLPAQNFESPADADGNNVYDITARVTDEDGNTGTTALSVTVTDVVYGQVNIAHSSIDGDGNITVGEGDSVAPLFSYAPYRQQGDLAGAPASVALRWRINGLGGEGSAAAADITLSNAGGPHRLAYSGTSALSRVVLAATTDDESPEPTETFGIELWTDSDDVLFHNLLANTWSDNNRLQIDYAISDDHQARLVFDRRFVGQIHEQDDPKTKDVAEHRKSYTVKLNFVPPPAGITVTPTLSPTTTRAILDKTSLSFTPTNWNTPQTVTVTAVDDAVANTPTVQQLDIEHSVSGAGDIDVETDFPVYVNVIDDDTTNQLSFDSPSVTEGDSGEATLTFTLTLLRPAQESLSVLLNPFTQGTTATPTPVGATPATPGPSHDFDRSDIHSRTITFAAGDTTRTFDVTVYGDVRHEGNETVKIHVQSRKPAALVLAPDLPRAGSATGIANAIASGTITDDDAAPDGIVLSLDPYTNKRTPSRTPENRADPNQRNFNVVATTLGDTLYGEDVSIALSVGKAGDTATAGTDFTSDFWSAGAAHQSVDLVLSEGLRSTADSNIFVDFRLRPTDDALDEDDEVFSIVGTSGAIAITPATHTITDDDGAPTVAVGDATAVTEGNDPKVTTNLAFTVTLSTASGRPVTVPYTLGGTAAADADYTDPATKSVTLAAGTTTGTITIPVKGDTLDEPNETVIVTLGTPTNATVATTEGAATGTGTITDDDATPTATLVLTPPAISEKGGTSTVTATLSAASSQAVTLTVTATPVAPAGAGDITLSPNKILTIPAGATASTGTVTLTANDNALDAADKTVTVAATATGGNGLAAPDAVTLTITDDDGAPTVAVGDATAVTEGNDPKVTTNLAFTVTLSTASGRPVTVPYTLGGTAAADADYTDPATKSVTLAAGTTTGTITIPVKGDTLDEPNETVIVTLGTPTNATVATTEGAATGTGTITDDDATPTATLVLTPPAISEKGGTSTVTATLSAASSQAVTLTVTATPVAPAGAGDITLSPNKILTIPAGATASTGTVTLTANDNALDAADKTVTVAATATGGNGLAAPDAVTLTITDDDGAPTVAVGDATAVTEGNDPKVTTNLAFTVTLSTASGRPVTVPYTLGGTAAADADYTDPATKSVTLAAGTTTGTITIPVKGDTLDEPNETVIVTLGTPTNATVATTEGAATGTGTITDDDATPTATLVLTPPAISEKGGTSTVTATLSAASSQAVTLTVTATPVAPAGAGDITLSPNKILTIPAGATASTGTVTLTANDNALDAADKTVTVAATATGGNGLAAPDAVTLTITDDDGAPTVAVGDATAVTEGNDPKVTTNLAFTVTLSTASGRPVTVPYTLGGTAAADADYTDPATKSVTLAAGTTTGTITIPVKGDTLDEPNETVIVTLGTPTNATVATTEGAATGTGTITDDDATPTATLVLTPPAISEKGGTSTVTATLSAASSQAVTLTVTATPVAPAGAGDITLSPNKILTIPAGATASTGTVTLTANDNALDAADKTVTVAATATGGNGLAAPDAVTLTITDDDGAPTVAVGDATAVTEGNDPKVTTNLAFTVTLSTASGRPVTVPYTLGGTAAADADYTDPATKSVTLAAGTTTGTITIPVKGDTLDEPNETVIVTLGTPTNATVATTEGAATATGTITDDDATPTATLVLTPPAISEKGGTSTVTATLSAASSQAVTLTVTATPVAPAGAGDITLSPNKILTIPAGATASTGTVTLTANDNALDAADKTVTVAATATGGNGLAAPDAVTLTITDDDGAPTVAVGDATAVEGGTATFDVTLSTPSSRAVTVTATTAEGTATDPEDYTHKTGILTIPAGATSVTFTVAIAHDTVAELDETFTVILSNATGATIAGATGTGTITGATALLSIADATAAEGDSLTFTVTRTGDTSGAATVQWTTADDTVEGADRAATTDYTARTTAATLSFKAGDATATISVATTEDTIDEPNETFRVVLANPSDGLVLADGTATGTITDDDTVPTGITLAVTPSSVAEDTAATVAVTATVAGGTTFAEAQTITVSVGAAGDTAVAGTDYVAVPNFDITLPAGVTSATGTFSLNPTDDDADEPDETLTVSGNSGSLDVTDAEVTITDDDAAPVLSISSLSVDEGDDPDTTTPMTFTVTLSTASGRAVTVAYADTGDGTATSGDDYAVVSAGTLTFAPGDTHKTVAVAVNGDTVDEADETVVLGLSSPVNATLDGGGTTLEATGTIIDDDFTPVTISIDDAEAMEGSYLEFRVHLSRPSPGNVEVSWRTVPGVARVTDFESGSGRLRFAEGEQEQVIEVWAYEDGIDDGHETMAVVLSDPAPAGVTLARARATGTILNADPLPAAWLSRFGRTVAEQTLEGIAGRLGASRTPGMEGTFAGQMLPFAPAGDGRASTRTNGAAGRHGSHTGGLGLARRDPGWPHTAGAGTPTERAQTMTEREVLLGSSFTMTGVPDSAGGNVAFWGRMAHGGFEGQTGTFSLDGEVTTMLLGADYARGRLLTGLALALSRGEGGYANGASGPGCDDADAMNEGCTPLEVKGTVEASLNAAIPYASVQVSERLALWGALGHGTGEVTVESALKDRFSSGTRWTMAAAGLRGDIIGTAVGGGPALAVTSDALWVRTASDPTADLAASDSRVTRLRLGLEGRWTHAVAGGGRLAPRLEAGVRHDGGDAETGFGIEAGGGLAWSDPASGLALDLSGRALVAHEAGRFKDWGVALDLAWDPTPETKRGWSTRLSRSHGGASSGGVAALLEPDVLPEPGDSDGGAWSAEAARGLGLGHGMVGSPYVRASGTPGVRGKMRAGYRIEPDAAHAEDATFDLWAELGTGEGGSAVGTGFEWRW